MSGERGIPDEPEMSFETETGKRSYETVGARGEATGARVSVGAFKGQHVELHCDGPYEVSVTDLRSPLRCARGATGLNGSIRPAAAECRQIYLDIGVR